jgi:hypothetical protein
VAKTPSFLVDLLNALLLNNHIVPILLLCILPLEFESAMFHISLLKKAIVALTLLNSSSAQSTSSGPSYSPARPPAIPLAVRGPYTSAWTSTFNGGTLNSNGVIFWPGNALGWEGLATVDGITYEYLGTGSQELPTIPSLQSAIPLTVSYDSQYSNFTFAAGPVELTASFLSPVLPEDLC